MAKRPAQFIVRQRADGRWHWKLVAANGNEYAQAAEGDGYPTRGAALRAVRAVQRSASDAVVVVEKA